MNDHANNFVKLPNSIYDDLNITNEELTILVLLYRNYISYKSIGVCSLQLLADYMMINTSNNKNIINTYRESIMSLVDKGYILNLYDVGFDELLIDNPAQNKYFPFLYELVPPPEDNFFNVYDMNLIHIFQHLKSMNISKFNIIRYYIACCRVSNNDSNFGYLTQGKLKQLVTDSRTIQKYNRILQDELHLIRYNNDYLTQDRHYCTTFIGKWDDKDNFNQQLQYEISNRGLVHTDKIKSNVKRSVKQKINNLENEVESDKTKIKELEEKLRQYEDLQYKEKTKDTGTYINDKPKPKGLLNKKRKEVEDDSEFIKEMGWDKEIIEEETDFSEFIDWNEEDEKLFS